MEPQSIPSPWTLPLAFTPAVFTVRAYVLGWNVAVTVFAEAIETVQVAPLVVVHPVQLLNSDVASGTAVSVRVAPFAST